VKRVAALAFVATLAACSSSTDGKDFAAKGNAVCRQLRARIARLGHPPLPSLQDPGQVRAWQRYQRRQAAVASRHLERLRALRPPRRLLRRRDQLFADVRRLARARPPAALEAAVERELRRNDLRAGERLLRRLEPFMRRGEALTRRVNADFRSLGWVACVSA
jgi:hypothetical protein